MSSPIHRIPPELARSLPWEALLQLFEVESTNQLETLLHLSRGTLSKAQRQYPVHQATASPRGVSARLHQILLEGIAKTFPTGEQMRDWMKKHWPRELLEQSNDSLEAIYEKIDITQRMVGVGIFPVDYIERDEKANILDLLMKNKQAQVIWLTGPGGAGKSTLALSLIHRDLGSLKKNYKEYLWVELDEHGYETGLLQIAEQIGLEGETIGVIEQRIKALTKKNRVLFILDGLCEKKCLEQWKQLAGYLGRLVVTSRVRLSGTDLSGDGQIRQIQVNGFSQAQGRQFFGSAAPDVDRIIEITGGSPLALRILSGMMRDTGMPSADVVTHLTQNALITLSNPGEAENPKTNVRACLALSYNVLCKDHPSAAEYLKVAGIFRTRTILKEYLDRIATVLSPDAFKCTITLFDLIIEQHAQILYRYNFLDFATISNERFIRFEPLLHAMAREYIEQEQDTRQKQVIKREYRKVFRELLGNIKTGSPTAQRRHVFMTKMHMQDIVAVLEAPGDELALPDYQALRQEWVTLIYGVYRPSLWELAASGQIEPCMQVRWQTAFKLLLTNMRGKQVYGENRGQAKEYFQQVLKAGDVFHQDAPERRIQQKLMGEQSFLSYETWCEFYGRQIGSAVLGLAQCHVDAGEWDAARSLLDRYRSVFINRNSITLSGWHGLMARIMNVRGETRETITQLSQAVGLSTHYQKGKQAGLAADTERYSNKGVSMKENVFVPETRQKRC